MRLTVEEVAKQMGVSKNFIRHGLIHNKLPFGFAIKMSSRYTYYINKNDFNNYLNRNERFN